MKQSLFIRCAGAVVLVALLKFMAAQIGVGSLTVEIRDGAGGLVPAMVCITSLADGKWRTPPDGTVVPPYTRVPDFYDPKPWKPGDIGPVRLTIGDYKNNETRSSIYGGISCYPFWKEPAMYFVSQPFSIKLPAGKWRLAVERGLEYLPVFEEFDVKPGDDMKRTVRLQRWVDMAKQGWYSGDDHVHYPRTKPEHDQFLLTWARAEDVHLLSVVQQRTLKLLTFPQGFANNAKHQEGDFALSSGQEDPSMTIDQQGHTLALNLPEPVFDMARFHLYDVMFDGAHARGGLTGYAHVSWAPEYYRRSRADLVPTWDSTINVIQRKLDFFEIMQFRRLGVDDYYDFLNLGVPLTAAAGADIPWAATVGEVRTYAYIGSGFSPESWFEAMKKGHTFVTDGPMLSLKVDNAMPGDQLKLPSKATVHVSARAWAPPEIGSPTALEIVAQGQVVRAEVWKNPGRELTIDARIPVDSSQWIAARVRTANGGLAHTTPVYVTVAGQPVLDREHLSALVAKRLAVLDYIDGRLHDPQYASSYAPGELQAHFERVEAARQKYKQMLQPATASK
jgi:hypothetical protein